MRKESRPFGPKKLGIDPKTHTIFCISETLPEYVDLQFFSSSTSGADSRSCDPEVGNGTQLKISRADSLCTGFSVKVEKGPDTKVEVREEDGYEYYVFDLAESVALEVLGHYEGTSFVGALIELASFLADNKITRYQWECFRDVIEDNRGNVLIEKTYKGKR